MLAAMPGVTTATAFRELMSQGGYVMWPLLVLSVLALGLILERAWFYARTNSSGVVGRVARMTKLMRAGKHGEAKALAEADGTVYGHVARALLNTEAGKAPTEALAIDAIESQRRRLERFMPTLSTIITAAPMLGILGTVLGIIASFEAISVQAQATGGMTDPREVGSGIAEALLTTATGLIIAVATLFPYNALRTQVDRTLSRLESLGAAAVEGGKSAVTEPSRGGDD